MATQTKNEEYIANQALLAVGAAPIRGFNLVGFVDATGTAHRNPTFAAGNVAAGETYITAAADINFVAGDTIHLWSVEGSTYLNGNSYSVASISEPDDLIRITLDSTGLAAGDNGFIIQNSAEGQVIAQHFVNVRDSMLGDHTWNFLTKRAKLTNPTLATVSPFASWSAGIATLTFASGVNTLVAGDQISVFSSSPSGYDARETVLTSTATTITYALATDPGGTPSAASVKLAPLWGFGNTYVLPSDFVELSNLNDLSEDYQIEMVGGLQLAIVSDESDMDISYIFRGRNSRLWPYKFVDAVAARLAADICIKLSGSVTKSQMLYNLAQRKLDDAIYHDEIQGPPKVLAPTEWVNARLGDTGYRRIGVTPQPL